MLEQNLWVDTGYGVRKGEESCKGLRCEMSYLQPKEEEKNCRVGNGKRSHANDRKRVKEEEMCCWIFNLGICASR